MNISIFVGVPGQGFKNSGQVLTINRERYDAAKDAEAFVCQQVADVLAQAGETRKIVRCTVTHSAIKELHGKTTNGTAGIYVTLGAAPAPVVAPPVTPPAARKAPRNTVAVSKSALTPAQKRAVTLAQHAFGVSSNLVINALIQPNDPALAR